MTSAIVNLLTIHRNNLPDTLKNFIDDPQQDPQPDPQQGSNHEYNVIIFNLLNQTNLDHDVYINNIDYTNDDPNEDITPIYILEDYTKTDVQNIEQMRYISTCHSIVYENYAKTLNTLFQLIQITDMDYNNQNLPLCDETDLKFEEIYEDHVLLVRRLNDNDNKDVILHILNNLYKMLFTALNVHIFNAIAYNYNYENNDYTTYAMTCLGLNEINIRTIYNLNQNVFSVNIIKRTNPDTIFLKSSTSDINYYYTKIKKNYFVLKIDNKEYTIINNFDITPNKEFMVRVDTSHVKDENGEYNPSNLPDDISTATIEYKTTSDYKSDFDSNKLAIASSNHNLNKQYDKYQKNINFITYFESLYSKIDIITIIFYIIFIIILFLVLFLDLSLNIRIFSSLIGIGGVVLLYVITIAMYDIKEPFNADTSNTYNSIVENINTKMDSFVNSNIITSDIVQMRSMHRDSMRAMDLDKLKLDKGNALYENNTKNTRNILNDKKHNLLLYTLRITLLTYLSIILLVFNILYSIHPEYNILIITLTSIAIIYIIFYYMYNVNKSVRSNYVNKYYPEVSDINNF
jgi:hypothetical protein